MIRTLAAAQTVPVRGDVAANLAEHVRLARIAAERGAEVVVFPELSLTGYELELAEELAFEERDPRLTPLTGLGLTVIAGAPVRIGSRLHIGAFILSPDGEVALYTKQRMGAFSEGGPPPEATVFEPGDSNPLVLGDMAAVAICADIGRPSHAEAAADRGARIYLASMFVIPEEYDRDAARLQSYAAGHSMAAVLANYGGPTGGLAAAGRSAIWSRAGELLVQLDAAGSGVAVASVS